MRLTTDVEVATSATFQDSNLINGDDEAQLDLENQDEGNSKQGKPNIFNRNYPWRFLATLSYLAKTGS